MNLHKYPRSIRDQSFVAGLVDGWIDKLDKLPLIILWRDETLIMSICSKGIKYLILYTE